MCHIKEVGMLCVFWEVVPHTLILVFNKHALKLKTNIKPASAFLMHLASALWPSVSKQQLKIKQKACKWELLHRSVHLETSSVSNL